MTKGPVAASPVRYERFNTPLACILLVACGLAMGSEASAGTQNADHRSSQNACGISAPYAPAASWAAEAGLSDPDSAGENDDDDDVAGGDAAVVVAVERPAAHELSLRVHLRSASWTSRTADGHSLRGPPSLNQDSSDLERSDDDDSDDRLTEVGIVATPLSHISPVAALAGPPPALSSFSVSRAQRAPPISSL